MIDWPSEPMASSTYRWIQWLASLMATLMQKGGRIVVLIQFSMNEDGASSAAWTLQESMCRRFTAPASGESGTQSQQPDTSAGLSPAARDAKDKISGGASYIADRSAISMILMF